MRWLSLLKLLWWLPRKVARFGLMVAITTNDVREAVILWRMERRNEWMIKRLKARLRRVGKQSEFLENLLDALG